MSPTLPFKPGGASQPARNLFGVGNQSADHALTDALARLGANRFVANVGVGADDEESRGAIAAVAADQVITAVHRIPAAAATYAPFPEGVDARLVRVLREKGIEQLYTH